MRKEKSEREKKNKKQETTVISSFCCFLPSLCIQFKIHLYLCQMEQQHAPLLLRCFPEIDTSIFEACHWSLAQMMDGRDSSVGSVVGLMNVSDGVFLNCCVQHMYVRDCVQGRHHGIIFRPNYPRLPPCSAFSSPSQLLVNIACGVCPQASAVRCRIRQEK